MEEKSIRRLSARQQEAAILLGHGESVTSTAKLCGTNRTTIYTWKSLPGFQALTNETQEEAMAAAGAKMSSLFHEALQTYGKLLKSKNEKTRLAAAKGIMDRFPSVEILSSTLDAIVRQKGGSYSTSLDPLYVRAVRRALGFSDGEPPPVPPCSL